MEGRRVSVRILFPKNPAGRFTADPFFPFKEKHPCKENKRSLAVLKLLLAQADVEDKIDAYSAVNFN